MHGGTQEFRTGGSGESIITFGGGANSLKGVPMSDQC